MDDTQPGVESRTLKYRQAAWVLLAMNLAYGLIVAWKLPPLGLNYLETAGYTLLLLVLSATLSWFVYRGTHTFTGVLAVVYGGRAVFAAYEVWSGPVFPLVPWVLPTLMVGFYFLARAAWDWP